MPTSMNIGAPSTLKGTDQQGSVVKGSASLAKALITYTPFGYTREHSLGTTGFVGGFKELAMGCYLLGNGYRAYSPTLYRFVASDSLSPFGIGGINAYAYCTGDPVNYIDPDGHGVLSAFKKIFGGNGEESLRALKGLSPRPQEESFFSRLFSANRKETREALSSHFVPPRNKKVPRSQASTPPLASTPASNAPKKTNQHILNARNPLQRPNTMQKTTSQNNSPVYTPLSREEHRSIQSKVNADYGREVDLKTLPNFRRAAYGLPPI
ncbi:MULTISPECIES: RHS repeat-associated core domain-containing protein [Pseudomonas]|nr:MULTISPECIES: RHS repeat-associated core domain-containing protein [Pseudomonas]